MARITTCIGLVIAGLSFLVCVHAECQCVNNTHAYTQYGTEFLYCHYQGVRWLPGSSMKNYDDCESADCEEGGIGTTLIVCPFGVSVNDIPVVDGCKAVQDGCFAKVIQDSNTLTVCPMLQSQVNQGGHNYGVNPAQIQAPTFVDVAQAAEAQEQEAAGEVAEAEEGDQFDIDGIRDDAGKGIDEHGDETMSTGTSYSTDTTPTTPGPTSTPESPPTA